MERNCNELDFGSALGETSLNVRAIWNRLPPEREKKFSLAWNILQMLHKSLSGMVKQHKAENRPKQWLNSLAIYVTRVCVTKMCPAFSKFLEMIASKTCNFLKAKSVLILKLLFLMFFLYWTLLLFYLFPGLPPAQCIFWQMLSRLKQLITLIFQ